MKDILFDEYRYYNLLINKANDLAGSYGFNRIETPVLERFKLYERSTGKDTDIVLKEMYDFVPRLQELYPGNKYVPDKIRQQLQILRDNGILEFVNRGEYRVI